MAIQMTTVTQRGNSQSVLIPAEFRLPSKKVKIYNTGGGVLLVDPKKLKGYNAALAALARRQKKVLEVLGNEK